MLFYLVVTAPLWWLLSPRYWNEEPNGWFVLSEDSKLSELVTLRFMYDFFP